MTRWQICASGISIHALLAESDGIISVGVRVTTAFLSTLSLRRATVQNLWEVWAIFISIHALLAESDTPKMDMRGWQC